MPGAATGCLHQHIQVLNTLFMFALSAYQTLARWRQIPSGWSPLNSWVAEHHSNINVGVATFNKQENAQAPFDMLSMAIAHRNEAIGDAVWGRPQDSRETLGTQQQVAFRSPGCHIPGSDSQNGSGDGGIGHQEACCYG